MSIAAIKGVIHGKTIELEEVPELPDGQRVSVQLQPEETPPKWLERFAVDPSVTPGKLVIKGTRLPVEELTLLVEQGRSDDELRRVYPSLTTDDTAAVRDYAKVPAGLRHSFGGWAEDSEELDAYLDWARQNRKLRRTEFAE
jgi:uncharacterized protein (DUF433 family)